MPFVDGFTGTTAVGAGRARFRSLRRVPDFPGMGRRGTGRVVSVATVVRGAVVKQFDPVLGNATDFVRGYRVAGPVPRDVSVDTVTGRVTVAADFTTIDDTSVTLYPFNGTGDGPPVTVALSMRELTPSYLDPVVGPPPVSNAFEAIQPITLQTDAIPPRRFTATNLPPGLFIDHDTGTIAGVPTGVTKTYETVVTIANQDGEFTQTLTFNVVNDGGSGVSPLTLTPELIHALTQFVDDDPYGTDALGGAGRVLGSTLTNAELASILRGVYALRRASESARQKRVNRANKKTFNDTRNTYVTDDGTGLHYKRPRPRPRSPARGPAGRATPAAVEQNE